MSYRPALVLISGGLDSVTALAWARQQRYDIQGALSFTYGQRHAREVHAAARIAVHYGVPHQTVVLAPIAGSCLTDGGAIPQGRDVGAVNEQIASTYVPNRNMILIAYAAAHALLGDATELIGGWNRADAVNYPDCRKDFLAAAEHTLRLATQRPFTIVCPLIDDDKPAIVRRALELQAPIEHTWTCYQGGEEACGSCAACQLRIAGFREVGVIDPVPYGGSIDWAGCKPYMRISR